MRGRALEHLAAAERELGLAREAWRARPPATAKGVGWSVLSIPERERVLELLGIGLSREAIRRVMHLDYGRPPSRHAIDAAKSRVGEASRGAGVAHTPARNGARA